jgi:hypothetical protein
VFLKRFFWVVLFQDRSFKLLVCDLLEFLDRFCFRIDIALADRMVQHVMFTVSWKEICAGTLKLLVYSN